MGFIPLPEEDAILAGLDQQRQAIAQGSLTIGPSQLANVTTIRRNYPWMAPGTTASLGLSGFGPQHPVVQQAAQAELSQNVNQTQGYKVGDHVFATRAEAKQYVKAQQVVQNFSQGGAFSDVVGTIKDAAGLLSNNYVTKYEGEHVPGIKEAQSVAKGVVRAGAVALETPLQALVGSQRVAASQPLFTPPNPFTAAEHVAEQTSGGQAIKAITEGQPVDLGTGYLPSSTSKVEEAQAAAARQYSPYLIGGHAWTPGRFLASQVFEPDTTGFNIASGAVDAGLALSKYDPASAALTTIGEERAAGKVFSNAPDIAGYYQGVRKFKNTTTADQFLNVSPVGKTFVKGVTDSSDPYVIYKAASKKGAEFPIVTADWKPGDPVFLDQLAKSKNPELTTQLLQDQMGSSIRQVPSWTPKGTLGVSVQPRYLGTIPGKTVDFNDPNGAWKTLESYMVNAKVPVGEQHTIFNNFVNGLGSKPGNYATIDATFGAVRRSLVAHGMDEGRARELTTVFRNRWDDTQAYNIDDIGNNVDVAAHIVGGEPNATPSPHLLSETMGNKIDLPFSYGDIRSTRLATANPAVKVLLDNGPVQSLTDALDSGLRYWRDLHILRPAITVRAVGTGQLEMAGTGMDSLAFHPFRAISAIMGSNPEGTFYRKLQNAAGKVDEFLPEWMTSHLPKGITQPGAFSTTMEGVPFTDIQNEFQKAYQAYQPGADKMFLNQWAKVGKDHPQYSRGLATETAQLASDPVASSIARLEPNAAKDWFYSGEGRTFRMELSQEPRYAILGDDSAAAKLASDQYIDDTYARIATKTGGDQRLLDAVKTGRVNDVPITNWAMIAKDEGSDARSVRRQFQQIADEGVGPDTVKVPRSITLPSTARSRMAQRLDAVEQHAYSGLLTRPTNYLMRDPFARQWYWRKEVPQLFPNMTADARATMLDRLDTAGLPTDLEGQLRGMHASLPDNPNGLDLASAETLAKRGTLHAHKDYLHNLYDKSRFFDAMRFVFPFGDAWQKMLSRWSKITVENPQVLRRTQQVVQGAKGSGFFHTDPTSGQEVFTYPGSGFLTDKVLGTPIPLQGAVSGLSLVGEGLPGFGPAVTLPASYLLPDKPSTDWIKGLLFPYGDKSTGNFFSDVSQELEPSWLNKIATGLSGNPNTDRLYANTVFDVARQLESTGDYNLHGPDASSEMNRLLNDAKDNAKWLYVIRGLAQSVSPSAPTPQFQAKDKSGNWTVLSKLSQEYNDTLKKTNDPQAALQDIIKRYGSDNFLVAQAKSKPLVPGLPSTSEGLSFQRANPGFVESYPNVWGLFAPQGGTFDYAAYQQQFSRDERQQLTPQQMVRFGNARLASQQYSVARAQFGASPDQGQLAYLHDLKDWLTQHYPGYGDSQPSYKQTPVLVGELQNAVKNPIAAKTDAGQGLKMYLDARTQAQQIAEQQGYKSPFSAKALTGVRNWLRDTAAWIAKNHPDFQPMWDQVFSRELKRDIVAPTAQAPEGISSLPTKVS